MMRIRTLLIAVALLIAATVTYAQHPRMVLLEEFTAMTCPPCAAAKPTVEQFIKPQDGILLITYHMDYPYPGDPFNVANNAHAQTRHSYYGVQGIPFGAVNGKQTSVSSLAALQAAANSVKAKESPLLVTVSEDRSKSPVQVTVTVTNDGTTALSSLVLHTALLTHYVDLTAQLKAANAQNVRYSVFDDSMLKMFPNANGATFSIAGGETKKFTYSYTPGTGNIWAPGQQYITAFVQEPNSKEVLQAGTNFFDISTSVKIESSTEKYLTTARSTPITKEFTLTNDKDKAVTVDVELVQNSTILPTGWDASLDKTTVSIPAKGTATVTLTGSSGDNGGFLFSVLKATPQSNGLNIETTYSFGYLAEKTKYAVLAGYSTGGFVHLNTVLSQSAKYNDYAMLPVADEIFNAYAPLSFEGVILPIDYDHRGALYASPGLCSVISDMISNGTRVLITSELDAFFTFDVANVGNGASPSAKALFNTLGIGGIKIGTDNQPIQRFDGSTGVVNAFTVKGVTNDAVGGGVTLSINKNNPYFNAYSTPLTMKAGTKAVPFMYFDATAANIAATRIETENSRAIFLGFGIDAIESPSSRSAFTNKLMDWLMEKPSPDISLLGLNNATSIAFGALEIGKTKEMTLDVKNTGVADLTVTGAEWGSPEDAEVFRIASGGTFPMTIKPGEKSVLTIEFKPKTEQSYATSLTFTSDAQSGPNNSIPVTGNAIKSTTSVDANVSSDGLLSVSVGPNPFNEQATVSYTVAGTVPQMVTLRLVDALGNTIQTIATGVATPGSHNATINGSAIAAGAYRVVMSAGTSSTFVPVVLVK